jgi:hypothetical protein
MIKKRRITWEVVPVEGVDVGGKIMKRSLVE